jgi:hypothetical protein
MMKKHHIILLGFIALYIVYAATAYALGENGKTLTYKITHDTSAGKLITYSHYNIAAQEENGYWLQRTTTMYQDSDPLSITQTLIEDFTHEALRYIMHRPAKMNTPANVIDLPLAKMGKDEVLPTPLTGAFSEPERVQLEAGTFETKKGQVGDVTYWVSLEIPVMGVAKVATNEWTMELVQIVDNATDLLPQKPPKGGIVYLKE